MYTFQTYLQRNMAESVKTETQTNEQFEYVKKDCRGIILKFLEKKIVYVK